MRLSEGRPKYEVVTLFERLVKSHHQAIVIEFNSVYLHAGRHVMECSDYASTCAIGISCKHVVGPQSQPGSQESALPQQVTIGESRLLQTSKCICGRQQTSYLLAQVLHGGLVMLIDCTFGS